MAKNVIKPSTPAPAGHPTSFAGKGKGSPNTPTQTTKGTADTVSSFNRERHFQTKAGKPVPMSQ